MSFALRFLVALAAFWLLDGAGVMQIAWLAGLFFSGMLLPLNVFPGALGEVARALPWSSLLQVPADVLLGRRTGWGRAGVRLPGRLGGGAAGAPGRLLQSVATGGWWSRVAEAGTRACCGTAAEPGGAAVGRAASPAAGRGRAGVRADRGDVDAVDDGVPGVVRDDDLRQLRGDRRSTSSRSC